MTAPPTPFDPATPLRIAYLTQQFPVPTETFAVSDVAALRALGHHVEVFTMRPARSDEQRLRALCAVPDDLPVHQPRVAALPRWLAAAARQPRAAGAVAARLAAALPRQPRPAAEGLACLPLAASIADRVAAGGFDVAHAFWSRHAALVLPLLARRAPAIVRSAFAGAYDLVADDVLMAIALGSADQIYTHAEANRDPLIARGAPPDRLVVVPRGIPLFDLPGTARDPFALMTASAMVEAKNVEGVLRAFAKARASEPRLTLDLFGDGPDRARLERLAATLGCADAARFHGHRPRAAILAAMSRAAVFLLLSRKASERLPNVLKEALWAGCAIVTSPSLGLDELLIDPGLGRIVPASDADAAGRAILDAISDPVDVAAARRARGRAHIAAAFSADASMARYVAEWRRHRAAPPAWSDQPLGRGA